MTNITQVLEATPDTITVLDNGREVTYETPQELFDTQLIDCNEGDRLIERYTYTPTIQDYCEHDLVRILNGMELNEIE